MGFIINSSRASRPKLPVDKDCLIINVMLCCNYVTFKNRISDLSTPVGSSNWRGAAQQPDQAHPKHCGLLCNTKNGHCASITAKTSMFTCYVLTENQQREVISTNTSLKAELQSQNASP